MDRTTPPLRRHYLQQQQEQPDQDGQKEEERAPPRRSYSPNNAPLRNHPCPEGIHSPILWGEEDHAINDSTTVAKQFVRHDRICLPDEGLHESFDERASLPGPKVHDGEANSCSRRVHSAEFRPASRSPAQLQNQDESHIERMPRLDHAYQNNCSIPLPHPLAQSFSQQLVEPLREGQQQQQPLSAPAPPSLDDFGETERAVLKWIADYSSTDSSPENDWGLRSSYQDEGDADIGLGLLNGCNQSSGDAEKSDRANNCLPINAAASKPDAAEPGANEGGQKTPSQDEGDSILSLACIKNKEINYEAEHSDNTNNSGEDEQGHELEVKERSNGTQEENDFLEAPAAAITARATSTRSNRCLGRKGDPRMHAAVSIRLADPSCTLLDALVGGGFCFPTAGNLGATDRNVRDEDGLLLYQRKNQLNRRLRLAKRRGKKNSRKKSAATKADEGKVVATSNRENVAKSNGLAGCNISETLSLKAEDINACSPTSSQYFGKQKCPHAHSHSKCPVAEDEEGEVHSVVNDLFLLAPKDVDEETMNNPDVSKNIDDPEFSSSHQHASWSSSDKANAIAGGRKRRPKHLSLEPQSPGKEYGGDGQQEKVQSIPEIQTLKRSLSGQAA